MNCNYEFVEYIDNIPFKSFITEINYFDPHWHNELEVIYVLKGEVKVVISNKSHMIKKNDIIIINSREIHYFEALQKDNILSITQINPRIVEYDFPMLAQTRFEFPAESINEASCYSISYELRKTITGIICELYNKNIGYRCFIHSRVIKLVTCLFRFFPYRTDSTTNLNIDNVNLKRIRSILDYVETHYAEDISLKDIAESLHLNIHYLTHLFKSNTGMSFGKYLSGYRIEKTKELLLRSDLLITDIALSCGFNNLKHFYRIFKEMCYCTPTEYKNSKNRVMKSKNDHESSSSKQYNYYGSVNINSIYELLEPKYIDALHFNKTKGEDKMVNLSVNINEKGEYFLPYWKKCITAGRAAEGLREDWRNQLREVQREIGFEYIRFHGIFHDDMMVYNETQDGSVSYNWQYFDSLFDFLLEVGLRPIFELGFMPTALATVPGTVFWWKGNGCPPNDYSKWHDLVKETVCHCINRYGLSEVLQWYFEVWNEPNLGSFWTGTQEEYYKLYETSVKAIKDIDPRLKVGGPSTSGADFRESKDGLPYMEAFLNFCSKNSLPVDFISAHPYPTYWPLDEEGVKSMGYMDEFSTHTHIKLVRDVVNRSPYKNAEIHLTEWNSSPSPRDLVHDTAFMAPFVIYNNLKCIGLVDSLGFWDFTDVFEENAAGATLFHGGFGLINLQGLKKPSYYGYWFLSKLGSEKLACGENYFIARKNEKIQILLWNFCYYNDSFANGNRKALTTLERYSIFKDKDLSFSLALEGLEGNYKVTTYTLGRENGSAFDIWVENGAPESPTKEELDIIMKKAGPDGSIKFLENINTFNQEILLKPHEVVFIELCHQI